MSGSTGTPELAELVDAYVRIIEGDALTSADRRVLAALIAQVLGDADPRPLFWRARKGAPTAPHRDFVGIHALLQPDLESQPKQAYGRVADAWGMSARTVREIVGGLGDDARVAIASLDADALSKVVEWHRLRYVADNSGSCPHT